MPTDPSDLRAKLLTIKAIMAGDPDTEFAIGFHPDDADAFAAEHLEAANLAGIRCIASEDIDPGSALVVPARDLEGDTR